MLKGALDLVTHSTRIEQTRRTRRGTRNSIRNDTNGLIQKIRSAIPHLLSTGLSVSDLYEIAKQQVLIEAIPLSLNLSGRPNQSQLSAITGLTRPEIRSLLRQREWDSKALAAISRSRSIRVARGWLLLICEDPRLNRLPLRGKRHSFTSLVREYSGDVPQAAMQKELLRLGWVRLFPKEGAIELNSRKVKSTLNALL